MAVVMVAAIILIVLGAGAGAVERYDNFLSGLWVGDPGFLKRAELLDFQLFLAPAEEDERQGYLVLTNSAGELVVNQAVEVGVSSAIPLGARWRSAFRAAHDTKADVFTLHDVSLEFDGPGEGPIPAKVNMAISILDGTLTLYDDKKVYAFLTKDYSSSAAALEAWNSTEESPPGN